MSFSDQFEIAGGSVSGRSHVLAGKGNQDAYHWAVQETSLVSPRRSPCDGGRAARARRRDWRLQRSQRPRQGRASLSDRRRQLPVRRVPLPRLPRALRRPIELRSAGEAPAALQAVLDRLRLARVRRDGDADAALGRALWRRLQAEIHLGARARVRATAPANHGVPPRGALSEARGPVRPRRVPEHGNRGSVDPDAGQGRRRYPQSVPALLAVGGASQGGASFSRAAVGGFGSP